MANALQLSKAELRKAIESGKYGLSYHSHPSSTYNKEYEFLLSSFADNILIWKCIKSGGHYLVFEKYYDSEEKKAVYRCKNCTYRKYD